MTTSMLQNDLHRIMTLPPEDHETIFGGEPWRWDDATKYPGILPVVNFSIYGYPPGWTKRRRLNDRIRAMECSK